MFLSSLGNRLYQRRRLRSATPSLFYLREQTSQVRIQELSERLQLPALIVFSPSGMLPSDVL